MMPRLPISQAPRSGRAGWFRPLEALLASVYAISLVACPGSLTITLDTEQGPAEDDDSDVGSEVDFSTLVGIESLHVDWDLTERPDGLTDCSGDWLVTGTNTTTDDSDLCPSCDHIWEISLTADSQALECLVGTQLEVEVEYVRTVGIAFDEASDVHFRFWRNDDSGDSPLAPAGIGALDPDGADFTWSGDDHNETSGLFGAYTFYYSGEGIFGDASEASDESR